MALRIDARHVGARLGLGWLAFSGGDRHAATRWWREAQELAPDDPRVAAVHRQLEAARSSAVPAQGPRPSASRTLFADIERGGARLALLVDEAGLVLAGTAPSPDGRDQADELGAELRGLSADAERALRQLQLGDWEQLHVECDLGTLALGPVPDGGVALVATDRETPAGLTRLLLDRARRVAGNWMSTL